MRRGRNQQKLPLEREVGVALSDEEVGDRSRKLCGTLSQIDGLRDEIRSVSKDRKDRIKGLEAEAKALRQQIQDGYEQRAQKDLRYEDTEQAKKVLAEVAQRAGDGKPLPSEAHPYESNGKLDECLLCGGTKGDPIHSKGLDAETVLGAVPPEESLGIAKARLVGRGKGPLERAKKRVQPSAKGARP